MTKIATIEINNRITVYIINNYKCFAKIVRDVNTYVVNDLLKIQNMIEEKLQAKILMVRHDNFVNVIEFYIIKEEGRSSESEGA